LVAEKICATRNILWFFVTWKVLELLKNLSMLCTLLIHLREKRYTQKFNVGRGFFANLLKFVRKYYLTVKLICCDRKIAHYKVDLNLWFTTIHMKISLISMWMESHFHVKGWLTLRERGLIKVIFFSLLFVRFQKVSLRRLKQQMKLLKREVWVSFKGIRIS